MLTLMAACHILLLALSATPDVATEAGQAAVFGYEGDELAGGPLACTGKALRPGQLVCAHRTLPCGTRLVVQNMSTQRLATCLVLDRGPYGASLPGGRFVIKRNAAQRGTWRGVVDVSPSVAARLGMRRSVANVRLVYLKEKRSRESGQSRRRPAV
ncbi:MAG TPA: septal ring lytic transglycosylase RlpA family protein [Pseudomonadota bacterium]|jgi:rare lipoprotein A (peptidoglycan hydrolase)|nr:septal ring lytic transglycosylase RlpA family protein [Pseudomonadota bacterium]HNK46218.1 septal ring lytic transglycosylase RlpA family protein [Pseudomonadota bacterium]HNN54322.1 septal ring lytic transglycosylase RlpA family protein [Pseudomonadota bacterium]HNO68636.1 septal ring lytic transglycosylase RlpA family protein [Pseudomonadota bacterium]